MADRDAMRDAVLRAVDTLREEIVALSRRIHGHPEPGLQERSAAGWCQELLARAGYANRDRAAGLDTAFVATLQGGRPGATVALTAEYDALPRLGHACGHNLVAGAVVGGALALTAVARELPGAVQVFGTPAEELGVGKPALLEAGLFAGVDAVLGYHPGPRTMARRGSNGLQLVEYGFHGRAGHSGQDPWSGTNALDAVLLLFAGVNALRQFVRDGTRIHGIVSHGGEAFNVTPEYASAELAVRSTDVAYLREVTARVVACAEGAARATGTRLETHERAFFDVLRFNATLYGVLERNMERLGLRPVAPGVIAASTDFGNVSQALPSIYFGTRTWPESVAFHTRDAAAAAASPEAEAAMLDGARCLAATVVDLLTEPDVLRAARVEFDGGRP